jgi:N-acetyl-anhydromuramyl-L-alanine amidase AmpD
VDPTGLSHPSPNQSARPKGVRPELIVLHATAGRSDAGDVAWCRNPAAKVSYHAIVGRDGTLYTLVPTFRKAWHAGVSEWQGRKDCNAFSLGLAFSNRHDGTEMLTASQIQTARACVDIWLAQYPGIRAMVTHGEIAPGRKDDPHRIPNFFRDDWQVHAFSED